MSDLNLQFDNSPVSKPAPQHRKVFFTLISIITIIPVILGTFIITALGSSIMMAFTIMMLICIFCSLYLYILIRYIHIYINEIHFSEDTLNIIMKNKEIEVNYPEIISFMFPFYSFDINGNPYPQYSVAWKRGVLMRDFYLTEENAKKLAEILSGKGYEFTWDESQKPRWQEYIEQKGYSVPSR